MQGDISVELSKSLNTDTNIALFVVHVFVRGYPFVQARLLEMCNFIGLHKMYKFALFTFRKSISISFKKNVGVYI